MLLNISNPPKVLYAKGNVDLLNKKSIAVVGSRRCSEYGKEIAWEFSNLLSTQNICIVSGLAVGIDTAAHIGAYKNIGRTIAVLGCGINKVYPPENKKLCERILNEGGCIISECDPNIEADLKKFPKRNRIIAGLSYATLVVEAKLKGGTMVTANLTNKQGKPVFCVPADINRKESKGTNLLIKKYGIFTTDVEDIFKGINTEFDKGELEKNMKNLKKELKDAQEQFLGFYNSTKNEYSKKENDEIFLKNKNNKDYLRMEDSEINLKSKNESCIKKEVCERYKPVYNLFGEKALSINEIYLQSGLEINNINEILTMLELEGLVKKEVGNKYSLV